MKKNKHNLIAYSDMSSNEELKLRLISNLLLDNSDGLDSNDVRELGHLLKSYLQRKVLLDHYFWGRRLSKIWMSKDSIKSEMRRIDEGLI